MLHRSIPNPRPPPGGTPGIVGNGQSGFGAVSVTHLSHTHAGKNITNLANGPVDRFIEGIKSILGARRVFGTFYGDLCID